MSVGDVFNVPVTPSDEAQWSFLHMALHRSQNLAIFRKYNAILPEYVLDPVNFASPGAWLEQHQQMHNNVDSVLGISAINLVDVDLSDLGERDGWVQEHAQLHQSETNALGITA